MKRYSFKSTLTADLSGTRWEAISGLKSEVSKVSMLSDGSIKRCIPNYMQQCEDKMIGIDKARVSFPTQTQLKRYNFGVLSRSRYVRTHLLNLSLAGSPQTALSSSVSNCAGFSLGPIVAIGIPHSYVYIYIYIGS